ncbi:MAG: glycine zipper 2TM domain-containing protein [Rhodoferax sp.]
MSASLEPIPAPPTRNVKPLWVAVGVLAAAVVALGGTLIYTQTRSAAPAAQVASVDQASPPPTTAVVTAPSLAAQANGATQKQPLAPVESEYKAPKKVAQPMHRQVAGMQPAPGEPAGYVVQAPPQPAATRPVCHVCGTVESVTPVERKGQGTGLGAVGGGVVGALVGNQFGGGNGRTVATILGAVGGGFAGNAIEKNVRKTTVYEIAIRMDDGTVRHLERRAPVAAGTRVTLQGNTLRTADGAQIEPVPAAPAPAPASANPYYTRG